MLGHLLQKLECSRANLDIDDELALVNRDRQLYVEMFRFFKCRVYQGLVKIQNKRLEAIFAKWLGPKLAALLAFLWLFLWLIDRLTQLSLGWHGGRGNSILTLLDLCDETMGFGIVCKII